MVHHLIVSSVLISARPVLTPLIVWNALLIMIELLVPLAPALKESMMISIMMNASPVVLPVQPAKIIMFARNALQIESGLNK